MDGTVKCTYCGYPIDIEDEFAFRKSVPMKLQSRLSHGVTENGQGGLYHEAPWQCLRAYLKAEEDKE